MLYILYKLLLDNYIEAYFSTTVGVCRWCTLSPVLFYIFLENIIYKTLTTIALSFLLVESRCGTTFCNIDLIEGADKELQNLMDRLKVQTHGMETNTVKVIQNDKAEIFINGVWIRMATAPPSMTRLDRVWCNHDIRLTTKLYKLYKLIVVPILFYGCET